MSYKKITWHIFILISLEFFLSAELLVLKQEGQKIVPLTEQDIISSGDSITKTVLKYQWPVCTAQNLLPEEQEELLSPDRPYAEELFITKKLQQVMQEDKINPQVVFIPTTLYELFFINRAHAMLSANDISNLMSLKTKMYKRILRQMPKTKYKIGTSKTVDELTADLQNKNINELLQFNNTKFYLHDENLHLDVNQAFLEMFFQKFPEAKNCHDAAMLSACIQEKSHALSQELMQGVFNQEETICEKNRINDVNLVKNFIDFEYEARQANKALLARGTQCQEALLDDNSGERKLLIGTTQTHSCGGYFNTIPYSISFGSSLFAGWQNDKTACVYEYLTNHCNIDRGYKKISGYTLLVDKKSYVQDNNSDLFFIPPLPTVTSVLSSGEYFHPRTKVAKFRKDHSLIKGVVDSSLYGLPKQLFVRKNPLQQAEEFSNFVAKNVKIIQAGSDCNLTDEEKKAHQEIIDNQKVAALFYKRMREQYE